MRTLKIATNNGPQDVQAKVIRLTIDGKPWRFMIHDHGALSDYRSGYQVGSLNSIKIECMCRWSMYHRVTDRDAAKILLDKIIARHGVDKVVAKMNAAPTLNT